MATVERALDADTEPAGSLVDVSSCCPFASALVPFSCSLLLCPAVSVTSPMHFALSAVLRGAIQQQTAADNRLQQREAAHRELTKTQERPYHIMGFAVFLNTGPNRFISIGV